MAFQKGDKLIRTQGSWLNVTRGDVVEVEMIHSNGSLVLVGHRGIFSTEFFEKVTQNSIERALTLLRATGKVEFTPNKPAFKAAEVTLNSSYHAVVTTSAVKVGCQEFSFGAIEGLWSAVQEAKAYVNKYGCE